MVKWGVGAVVAAGVLGRGGARLEASWGSAGLTAGGSALGCGPSGKRQSWHAQAVQPLGSRAVPCAYTDTGCLLRAPPRPQEDLLLINPDASPPVARIVDWSKYKYELEKGAKERKAKSTVWVAGEGERTSPGCGGALLSYVRRCGRVVARVLHCASLNLFPVAAFPATPAQCGNQGGAAAAHHGLGGHCRQAQELQQVPV